MEQTALNFDELNGLKNIPISALTELTETKPEKDIFSLADHTETGNPGTMPPPPVQKQQQGQRQPITAMPGNPTSITAGQLIPASLAAEMADMIIPVLLVLTLKITTKKEIHKSHFQATPQERAMIEPVLQNYLNSLQVNIDKPINALLTVLACVYGTKVIEITAGINDKQPRQDTPKEQRPATNKDRNEYQKEYQRKYRERLKAQKQNG